MQEVRSEAVTQAAQAEEQAKTADTSIHDLQQQLISQQQQFDAQQSNVIAAHQERDSLAAALLVRPKCVAQLLDAVTMRRTVQMPSWLRCRCRLKPESQPWPERSACCADMQVGPGQSG